MSGGTEYSGSVRSSTNYRSTIISRIEAVANTQVRSPVWLMGLHVSFFRYYSTKVAIIRPAVRLIVFSQSLGVADILVQLLSDN